MPRYYFDIAHPSPQPDADGSDLLDIHAARAAALHLCGEMIRELGGIYWQKPLWQLRVTDANRHPLFTLTFAGEDQAPHA